MTKIIPMHKDSRLGTYGIPFTFPTITIRNEIAKAAPNLKTMPLKKIDSIYTQYKSLVTDGKFEPYGAGSTPMVEAIASNTGFSLGEVRITLYTIRKLAEAGKIDTEYWKIIPASQSFTAKAANYKDSMFTMTNNIKWIGIAAIAGVALYFTFPILKKLRG